MREVIYNGLLVTSLFVLLSLGVALMVGAYDALKWFIRRGLRRRGERLMRERYGRR